jgi:hypothetical protein
MYRLDNCVRRRRQEAMDQVRAGDRLRLGATVPLELGSEPAEGEQRSVHIERKPNHVLLFGLRVRLRRVLREAIRREGTGSQV